MRLSVPGHKDLRKIVVLNPKGGCGKSTLATNLAGYLAAHGNSVAIMDFDPHGPVIPPPFTAFPLTTFAAARRAAGNYACHRPCVTSLLIHLHRFRPRTLRS